MTASEKLRIWLSVSYKIKQITKTSSKGVFSHIYVDGTIIHGNDTKKVISHIYQWDRSGTFSHRVSSNRPCVNGTSCFFLHLWQFSQYALPPDLHYIPSFVGDSQCPTHCPWENIRGRSYSRVEVACINNIVDCYPIVVFGGSLSSLVVFFHVCAGGVFLSSSGWLALYRSGCSHRVFFFLGIYCFFSKVLDSVYKNNFWNIIERRYRRSFWINKVYCISSFWNPLWIHVRMNWGGFRGLW